MRHGSSHTQCTKQSVHLSIFVCCSISIKCLARVVCGRKQTTATYISLYTHLVRPTKRQVISPIGPLWTTAPLLGDIGDNSRHVKGCLLRRYSSMIGLDRRTERQTDSLTDSLTELINFQRRTQLISQIGFGCRKSKIESSH